jgi:predicted Zn-dependent protease
MLRTLFAAAVALLTTLTAAADPIDLPQMGEPADLALSPADEARIGTEVVHEMYREDIVVRDPEVTEYLSSLGWRLAAAGTPNPPPFHFYLIGDPRINAFALPGGHIGMNAGTVIAASAESELAAVLAHEEAHVTQRHIAREINNTQAADIATWAAVLAAIIAGSANPNVVMGALSLGQGINYNRQISYTRANEMEADRIGIRTLANAGFNPNSMADFFQRLEQQTRLYGAGLPEILQTHPVNTTRIAEATERAAEYPKRSYSDSIAFQLMRARTRVLISNPPGSAADWFRSRIEKGDASAENRYGYAYALSESGHYAQALDTLQPLLKAYPKQPEVALLQADILMSLHRNADAMAIYNKTVAANPNYPPAILENAQALIDAGSAEAARQLMLAHLQAIEHHIETSHLLAQAASATGNVAEAQFQTANYLFAQGDARGAIEQIDAGLRVSNISADDRARLLARRREIIGTLPRGQLSPG